jgi:hypothetical protein
MCLSRRYHAVPTEERSIKPSSSSKRRRKLVQGSMYEPFQKNRNFLHENKIRRNKKYIKRLYGRPGGSSPLVLAKMEKGGVDRKPPAKGRAGQGARLPSGILFSFAI